MGLTGERDSEDVWTPLSVVVCFVWKKGVLI
jgi:hypothetical protein